MTGRATHRRSRTSEWWIWLAMKQRCHNPTSKDYPDYGGRGITVCARWLDECGFQNFLADMGLRPSKSYSLNRKENDGPYSPENCCWSTATEQARNRRRRRLETYSRGESNGWAALTAEQVIDARASHANGESYGSISRRLGVARMTVTRACKRESWKHL